MPFEHAPTLQQNKLTLCIYHPHGHNHGQDFDPCGTQFRCRATPRGGVFDHWSYRELDLGDAQSFERLDKFRGVFGLQ